jgi:spore coat polysaccharide biosynthesis protein SpsF (cytidylyltransferase family)
MTEEDEAFEELSRKQGYWGLQGSRKHQILRYSENVERKGTSMTDKEALIERLATTCLGLDAVDPLRLLVGDVVLALRQTPQRTWVGLTNQEQLDIFAQSVAKKRSDYEHYKAIEQALKEKNQ